jgi:hypothetical protein
MRLHQRDRQAARKAHGLRRKSVYGDQKGMRPLSVTTPDVDRLHIAGLRAVVQTAGDGVPTGGLHEQQVGEAIIGALDRKSAPYEEALDLSLECCAVKAAPALGRFLQLLLSGSVLLCLALPGSDRLFSLRAQGRGLSRARLFVDLSSLASRLTLTLRSLASRRYQRRTGNCLLFTALLGLRCEPHLSSLPGQPCAAQGEQAEADGPFGTDQTQ